MACRVRWYNRYLFIIVSVLILAGTIIAVVLIPINDANEQLHYHEDLCPVSECNITDIRVRTVREEQTTMWSGSFYYSVTFHNITYPVFVSFLWYEPNNYPFYRDCTSPNITCAYDDRDLPGSISRTHLRYFRPLGFMMAILGFAGVVFVLVFVLGFVHYHNLAKLKKEMPIDPENDVEMTPRGDPQIAEVPVIVRPMKGVMMV